MITIHTTSKETPDALWTQYEQVLCSQSPDAITPSGVRARTLAMFEEIDRSQLSLLLRDGNVIGGVQTIVFGNNPERMRTLFDPILPESETDDAVLSALRGIARDLMIEHGAPHVYTKSKDASVLRLAERLGAHKIATTLHATLDMKRANYELIDRTLVEQAERWPQFTLRNYTKLPDALIEEFCETFTSFIHSMPDYHEVTEVIPDSIRRRQDRRAETTVYYRYLLMSPDGHIAGHTNVQLDLERPTIAHQHMTGVHADYRGRNFGLWMKSAMYTRLREDFPEIRYIHTDTLAQNGYMRRINDLLGFETTAEGAEYKLPLSAVA